MLGKQFDGSAVGYGIGLRQVLHGFDQQALPVHITRIRGALAAFAPNLGRNRDRKNLGHAIGVSGVYKVPTDKRRKSSIPPASCFSAPNLYFMEGSSKVSGRSALRRYELGLAGSLELEDGVGNLFVHLDTGILGQAKVARTAEKELLLHRNSAGWVNPQDDVGDVIARAGRLRNQVQLGGIQTVDGFVAQVFHIERFQDVMSTAAEAQ